MNKNKNKISNPNLVMGFRQVMRGLASDQIRCVVIACDIDDRLYDQIVRACKEKGVECQKGEARKALGAILGLEVSCGVFAELLVENSEE